MSVARIGIVGGGLMGRELAAAIGRWAALDDHPVPPRLEAVCDTNPEALAWFDRIDTVRLLTGDRDELLEDPDLDVLYLAVPHHLHERLYLDAIAAGKDFLGEKPFGIDLGAGRRIVAALDAADVFARCSSEMPFFPGAQLAYDTIRSGALGEVIEVEHAFLHSSDLDRAKPINWKRQAAYCGEIGVMGDLGMHVAAPAAAPRLAPAARLRAAPGHRAPSGPAPTASPSPATRGTTRRCTPTPASRSRCDQAHRARPDQHVADPRARHGRRREFSTANPKAVHRFAVRDGRQVWERLEAGSQSAFPTVTGPIFEFGFADAILQMWAAFLAERAARSATASAAPRRRRR